MPENQEKNVQAVTEQKDYNAIKRTKEYRLVHKSLITQLETNGVVIVDEHNKDNTFGKHFLDLAEDYMSMWITKQLLIQDIRQRGVSVFYNNGGGQTGFKKNDSVEQLVRVNGQMLKLLNDLGIKPSLITDGQTGGGNDGNGGCDL
jgi:hypothetical protein